MTPEILKSNDELLAYLRVLQKTLGSEGEYELAELAAHAQRFSSGSPSEFLHEAELALKAIERQSKSLSQEQLQQVAMIIAQIERAFEAIGGHSPPTPVPG